MDGDQPYEQRGAGGSTADLEFAPSSYVLIDGVPDYEPDPEFVPSGRSRRAFLRDAGATAALALTPGALGVLGTAVAVEAAIPAKPAGLPLGSVFDPSQWPTPSFPTVEDIETYLLNKIGITGWPPSPPDKDPADVTLTMTTPLTVNLPGLTGFTLVLNKPLGPLTVTVDRAGTTATFHNLPVTLELDPSIFVPMKKVGSDWQEDVGKAHADFTTTVKVGLDGGISFPGAAPTINFSPMQIGHSGVILDVSGVSLKLAADTVPATDRGLSIASAVVYYKPMAAMTFTATKVHIGNNGFSGTLTTTFGNLSTKLLGFGVKLTKFEAIFAQNSLVSTDIQGQITIPFFDAPYDVEISFNHTGDVSITAKGNGDLSLPPLYDLHLNSFSFVESTDPTTGAAKSKMKLDMKLTPKPINVLGINLNVLPEFDLGGLILDELGNVDPEFGVIDQDNAKHFTVAGFDFECDKLALGFDLLSGDKYIALKGGIKFPEGLPVGVSVDGLKIFFKTSPPAFTNIELKGIGVDLEIPDVLKLKGSVSLGSIPNGGKGFSGSIDITIVPLELHAYATLVVQESPFSAWYLDIGVDLPAGIPLGPSGLAIYGFEGLFGYNYKPDRKPTENWYRGTPADFTDASKGWYYRNPVKNVRDPQKWAPKQGYFAFGLGVTLGTAVDDATAVAVRALVIVSVPGPVIIIDGAAAILEGRSGLDDPQFNTLMVIDGENDTFELGIDADIALPTSGVKGGLVEITGSIDAFFDGKHPDRWHLYLGQQPRPLRIGATILKLFRADSYFMLTNDNVRFGAWVGYENSWDFGPVSASVSAYIEGDALISWRPPQLAGSLHLHGSLSLSVFGIGFSLSADATFCVNVANPFHVEATVSIHIGLPWPLPDINASITLSWSDGSAPPAENPLQQVALRHPLTLENMNAAAAIGGAPTVPVDWRPIIAFSHDLVNKIPQATLAIQGPLGPANPIERINPNGTPPVPNCNDFPEPAWSFALTGLTVEESANNGGSWSPYSPVWASWLAVPGRTQSVPGTRLLSFFTTNPYDYALNSSDTGYIDWFNNAYSVYPCSAGNSRQGYNQQCIDLRRDGNGLYLTEQFPVSDLTCIPSSTVYRDGYGIRYTSTVEMMLHTRARLVRVTAQGSRSTGGFGGGFTLVAYYMGAEVAHAHAALSNGAWVATVSTPVNAAPIDQVNVVPDYKAPVNELFKEGLLLSQARPLAPAETPALRARAADTASPPQPPAPLIQVCFIESAGVSRGQWIAQQNAYLSAQTVTNSQHWAGSGDIFNPHKLYRLTVTTAVTYYIDANNVPGSAKPPQNFSDAFYFRTGDGPQLTDGLVPYVEQRQPTSTSEPPVLPGVTPDSSGWTIPANDDKIAFRSYDLAVRFRVPWVHAMYTGAHTPLLFDLVDLNGHPATDTAGHPLTNLYADAPEHLVTTEENAWFSHIDATCAKIDPSTMHTDTIYTITGNGPNPINLRPNMFYTVRLREQGNPTILYHYSFATSAFSTFVDMVKSFNDGPVTGKPWKAKGIPLSAAQSASLHGKVVTAGGIIGRDQETAIFDDIATLFGHQTLKWPARTEVTLFTRQVNPTTEAGMALLVEMPQPLDWERTTFYAYRIFGPPPYLPFAVTKIRNFDNTRIWLFIPGLGTLLPGTYRLRFGYKRDLGPGKPVYSVGGDKSDEVATIQFKVNY